MPDDNILRVGTAVDIGGIQSGMAGAASAVESNVSLILDQFGRVQAASTRAAQSVASSFSAMGKAAPPVVFASQSIVAQFNNIEQAGTRAGFNVRYAFLGVKDLMEGRTRFAIAEAANELIRMGGADACHRRHHRSYRRYRLRGV